MALKNTLEWARNEWGLFAKGTDRFRWLRQWVPFGMRTIGYGTLSITLGPFTRGGVSTWAARRWSQSSARGLRISIEADGLDNTPTTGFVFASNHQSLIDILVLGAVLPGDFKWAAKRSVMNVPFLGWHLRLAGHVPVDRQQGKGAALAVIHAFESVLVREQPLLVFPEGTRSEDGQIKTFKNGGFQAAVNTQRPIVPVALEGTYALMSRKEVDTGSYSDPGAMRTVRVRVGTPIDPNPNLSSEDQVADLRDRTHAAVVDMHDALVREAEREKQQEAGAQAPTAVAAQRDSAP